MLKGFFYGWNKSEGANIWDWISTKWDEAKVRSDFAEMQKMGVTLTRIFIADAQYINWDWAWDKGYQGFNQYIVNVDKLFQIAREYGMQVIFVIIFPEGSFHWDALNRPAQRQSYLDMMRDLAQRFKDERAIYSFDIFNEPYSNIERDVPGAEGSPSTSAITAEILHTYLVDCYNTIKSVDPTRLVSFEEGGGQGGSLDRYFPLIDDCVDYYQFDIYRDATEIETNGLESMIPRQSELNKPIIFGEVGANIQLDHLLDPHYTAETIDIMWKQSNKFADKWKIQAMLPFCFAADNIIDSITHEWKEGAYVIQSWFTPTLSPLIPILLIVGLLYLLTRRG